MISPKDCTKEELIHFINRTMFFDKNKFDSEIKLFRLNNYSLKADEEFKIYQKLTSEYVEILKKYDGMKMTDIPLDDLNRITYLSKEKEKHYKKSNELWEKLRGV